MISVVIPALNEAEGIVAALRALPSGVEVIVADGGSADGTAALAAPYARVVAAPRGRARQMNAGAAAARGDVLLFLHADTFLPPEALGQVQRCLAAPEAEAGAFRLRFDASSPALRFYGWCTRLPLRWICFGDRGLFVRREVFEAVGGFPEAPIFEDLEMVRRLHARGGFRFLPAAVTTSARRFLETGTLRQQLLNAQLWVHYLRGGDLHAAAARYRYRAPNGEEL